MRIVAAIMLLLPVFLVGCSSDKVFDDQLWARDFEAKFEAGVQSLEKLEGARVTAEIKRKAVSAAKDYSDHAKSLRDQLSFAYRAASEDYRHAESAEERHLIRTQRNQIAQQANGQLQRAQAINGLISAWTSNPTDAAFERLNQSIVDLSVPAALENPYIERFKEPEVVAIKTPVTPDAGELAVKRVAREKREEILFDRKSQRQTFDVTVGNSSRKQSIALYFEVEYQYFKGPFASVDPGTTLKPIEKYRVVMDVDVEDGSLKRTRIDIDPGMVLPAGTEDQPSLTTFRVEVMYDLVGRLRYHPNMGWDLHWSLILVDDLGRRATLINRRSWHDRSVNGSKE